MAYVIGIDEAGYGPNLGPIVIGGSLWHVASDHDPGSVPNGGFADLANFNAADGPLADTFADSKKLFNRGSGLGRIEQPILALLGCIDSPDNDPDGVVDLFSMLTGQQSDFFHNEPGYCWRDVSFPQSCGREAIGILRKQMREKLAESKTRCLSLASTMIFPCAWNEGLIREGNKASLLSSLSCRLLKRLLKMMDERESATIEPVFVYCDKHGGRDHYAALLQHELTCNYIKVRFETREQSAYTWQDNFGRSIEVAFSARGESQTPVAVASMTAKYLRELAMAGWNHFWQREIPDLQPTAGYPRDAKRFRNDIDHTIKRLRIPENSIWRDR